eukprot:CAMPEP_0171900794 /NCGR_PEP_ID=MMETSP0992-20121227/49964_1 /TAXON_ID=483369 /ORGANISM="non described non described, Strain CCMP2098" /LENGTH=760 /DNA_ID=CAMNT_0012529223 /DNA_START=19 /DNA_END=2301 /DNA_ORIENTATION=+
MMSGDDRVIRAANLQRSAMESTGVRNSSSSVIAGGTAFAEQIMTKSTTLRHSDSGEWAEVQKAAFTDWINSTLRERGAKVEEDLYTELADGTILYNLLEVLSGESLLKYGRLTGGKMRIQQIANCSLSFKFLAKHVKIVDIGPTDIVDGNPKRVLGLIWAIFVFYEVLSIPDVKSVSDLKAKILCWVKRRTLPFKAQGVARVFSYEQVMLTYLVELYNRLPREMDRTLATVMVYLKVSKWWAKVKADRRRQREATAMHKRTGREPSREQVDARIKADKQLGGGMSPSSNQNQNRHQPHHHHRPNPGLQDPALYPSSPSRVSFNDVHHHYSNNRHTSNDHAHSGDLVPVEQSLSSYSPRKLHTPLLDAELLLINDSSNGGQAMREQPAVDYNRELRAPHAFPEYVCVVCVHGLRNLDQERAGDVGSLALECTSDNCLDQALTRGAAQTQSCYDSTVVKYGESVGWALTSAIVHVPASTSTSTLNCKLTLRVLGLDDEEMFSTRVPLPQTLTQAELLAPPNTSHPPTAAAGGAGGGGGLVDQLNSTPLEWVNSDGPGLAQCSYSVVKLHFRDLALVVKELCHAKDELSAVDEEAESLTQQAEAVLFSMGNSSGVRALNGEDGSDGTPYLGRLLQLIALDVNHDKAETHAELEERLERLEHENEGLRRAMRDETRRSVSAARQAEEWEDQMRAAAEQMAHERRAHVSEVREQEAAKEWAARQEELEAEAFVESSKQARGDDLRRLQARRELDEYRASLGLFGL